MRARRTPRGLPLLSLGIVLASWVVVRAALWDAPFDPHGGALQMASHATVPAIVADKVDQPATSEGAADAAVAPSPAVPQPPDWLRAPAPQPLERPDFTPALDPRPVVGSAVGKGGLRNADRLIAHTMLLAAGYRSGTEPSQNLPYDPGAGPVAPGAINAPAADKDLRDLSPARRWSADMWALWRDDTTTVLTSGRPSYGRSQAGAALRYRLAPSSSHAPQLHLRGTLALEGAKEGDIAAGVSARPLGGIPIRLAAEARVSDTDRGSELRGAAYAVSELRPLSLPGRISAEAYVQGGYVSGDYATGFVDGQARLTRQLAGSEDFRLTAGGGAWGGWQEDAGRLDIGPSAGLSFRIGAGRGRISADYRFRVAGDAEPASGPALTLSAGF